MKTKYLFIGLTSLLSSAQAATNIFELTPTIAAPNTIYEGHTAVAYYKVTNNTSQTLTNIGVSNLPQGVAQDPVGSGLSPEGLITCRNTFSLAPGTSCLLKLNIVADLMSAKISSGPTVCQNAASGTPLFCSTPHLTSDILNINKAPIASSAPNLSISPSSIDLPTGSLQSIVVTNNSSTTINNIQPNFSDTALENKVEIIDLNYTNECMNLAPNQSCTLYLVSYQQVNTSSTNFTISGANTKPVSAAASITYAPPTLIYTQLHQDILYNADYWADNLYIMAANYAFEGIQGITNGEQYVKNAGGAWNTVYTENPPYGAQTSAGDTGTMATADGYPVYYGDAMPVCFSWPVLPSTVNPTSFKLTLNTGLDVYPDIATISPNYLYNERSCVVIFGKYGNRLTPDQTGAVYPTKLTIVDNGHDLTFVAPDGSTQSGVGLTFDCKHSYIPNAGPTLLAAKLSIMNAAGQCVAPSAFNGAIPNDGIAMYTAPYAQYRLRLFTSGGFALGNIAPSSTRAVSLMPTDFSMLFKVQVVANGQTTWLYQANKTYNIAGYGNITISGLEALAKAGTPLNDAYVQDENNQIDIVLYGDEAAMRQITAVVIPASGTNPETGETYLPLYNPGGPGNNPTPGIIYSSPGPSVTMQVTQAIDDAKTVNYGATADPCV